MCVRVANEIDYLRNFIDESGACPDQRVTTRGAGFSTNFHKFTVNYHE